MNLQPLVPQIVIFALMLTAAGVYASLRKNLPPRGRAYTAVVLVLGLAMLEGPVIGGTDMQARVASSNANVLIVVDLTTSMSAEDYDGKSKRIKGVRKDIKQVAQSIPGARYSLVTFSHDAIVAMPTTPDHDALEIAASALLTEQMYHSKGSSIDAPIAVMKQQLQRMHKQAPDNMMIVVYMGDGEQTSKQKPKSFSELNDLVDAGAVMGYGSSQGGVMKINNDNTCPDDDPSGCYVTSPSTYEKKAVSKIDEANLRSIAKQLDVSYINRNGGGGIDAKDLAAQDVKYTLKSRNVSGGLPLYFFIANIMAAILLLQLASALRDYRQGRDLDRRLRKAGRS